MNAGRFDLVKRAWGLLSALLIVSSLIGCDRVVESVDDVNKAVEIQGTWEFATLRGGVAEEREIEKTLSGTLILSSDFTFSNEQVVSGDDGWRNFGHGTWTVDDGHVVLRYEEKDGQPHYGEVRIEITGNELILGDYEAEGFVFVYLKK